MEDLLGYVLAGLFGLFKTTLELFAPILDEIEWPIAGPEQRDGVQAPNVQPTSDRNDLHQDDSVGK